MGLLDLPGRMLSTLGIGGGTRDENDDDAGRENDVDARDDADDDEGPQADFDQPQDDPDDVEDEPEEVEDDSTDSEDEQPDDEDAEAEEQPSGEAADDDEATGGGDSPSADEGETDISDIPAPSVGPHTTFEKDDPEERMARQEQSRVDAMGLDKRREVIGGSYSPSVARQLTTYGIVLAVVGAIVVGFVMLANNLDQPPDKYEDKAPWSQADAEQVKPPPVDFPQYGEISPSDGTQN